MPAITMTMERRTIYEDNRRRLSRAASIASGIAVVVFVVLLFLPRHTETERIVEIPMRKITLQQVAALPPPPRVDYQQPVTQQVNVHSVPDAEMPQGNITAPAIRRSAEPPLDPDAGKLGRARAEQVTARLASATSRIDRTLMGLSSSLAKGADGLPDGPRTRRERNIGSGRSEGDLAAYTGKASSGGTTDLGGSRVSATGVAIGTLAPSGGGEDAGPSADGEAGGGAPPGTYRSNASLLAVIQKYAAGIQYCYENELRRDPHLAGKLVVMISIAASGEVLDVRVVQDGVGSSRLSSCALSQIREWRFPAIPKGVTTFQTPFVFTPPN